MAIKNSEKEAMKSALKEALAEGLHEHREFFHDLLSEVLEDFAIAEAIRKGRESEQVPRADVMAILEQKAK